MVVEFDDPELLATYGPGIGGTVKDVRPDQVKAVFTRAPGVCGGRWCIAGHRIEVSMLEE